MAGLEVGEGFQAVVWEEITRLVFRTCAQWRTVIQSHCDSFTGYLPLSKQDLT